MIRAVVILLCLTTDRKEKTRTNKGQKKDTKKVRIEGIGGEGRHRYDADVDEMNMDMG